MRFPTLMEIDHHISHRKEHPGEIVRNLHVRRSMGFSWKGAIEIRPLRPRRVPAHAASREMTRHDHDPPVSPGRPESRR